MGTLKIEYQRGRRITRKQYGGHEANFKPPLYWITTCRGSMTGSMRGRVQN